MRQLFAGRIPDRRSIGLSLNTGRCAFGDFHSEHIRVVGRQALGRISMTRT